MNELISELVGYGIEKGLVEEDDKIYVINRLLELFRLDSYTQTDKAIRQLSEILSDMTDYAAEHGLIPETPLVLHGASTVLKEFVDKCNQYGGDIP